MFIPVGERHHASTGSNLWEWFGIGYCAPHFGEVLQGKFTLPDGGVERGLVTMPYRRQGVISQVRAKPGTGRISGTLSKKKTARAIELYLESHGLGDSMDVSFILPISACEGIGLGTSTSDIVATLRALDHALGQSSSPEELAKLAVRAEIASDSTMFGSSAVLFAQRQGVTLERFAQRLPRMMAVGMNLQPGAVFPTAETPPADYTPDEVAEFDRLRDLLRSAIVDGNAINIAVVAQRSAVINQRHFPKGNLDTFLAIAKQNKALGISISHSGSIGAILFAPHEAPDIRKIYQIFAESAECGFEPIETFLI